MSTMTAHAYLRNATGRAVAIHDSAHPSPDTVEAGEVVRVDQGAGASLRESGFETVKATDWTDPHAEPVEPEAAPAPSLAKPKRQRRKPAAQPAPVVDPVQLEQSDGDPSVDTTEAAAAEDDTEGDAS